MGRHQGYTLLELMVVLAIFSIIALASWQVLQRVVATKSALDVRSAQLRQLQKGLWLLSRDLHAVINRPVRDNTGATEPAFSSLVPGYSLLLTRNGWANPLHQPRSQLQRVGYGLVPDDNGARQLVRYYWPVLDRATNTEPRAQVVIDNLESLDMQFIDARGGVHFYWPPAADEQGTLTLPPIPAGVKVRLHLSAWGDIERVYSVRDRVLEQGAAP